VCKPLSEVLERFIDANPVPRGPWYAQDPDEEEDKCDFCGEGGEDGGGLCALWQVSTWCWMRLFLVGTRLNGENIAHSLPPLMSRNR